MRGDFAIVPAGPPRRALRRMPAWFIVSRCGEDAQYLTIALADANGGASGRAAPSGLVPVLTRVGRLSGGNGQGGEWRFALLRALPEGLVVAGAFCPADGHLE
jgi:hypothetical protein